jgi:hypothetical protein
MRNTMAIKQRTVTIEQVPLRGRKRAVGYRVGHTVFRTEKEAREHRDYLCGLYARMRVEVKDGLGRRIA